MDCKKFTVGNGNVFSMTYVFSELRNLIQDGDMFAAKVLKIRIVCFLFIFNNIIHA
jgi:hypothetical protein